MIILFICAHVSVSEENKQTLAEIRNEGAPAIPQKQKTSKAERRAIQEAQRAAKAAAKEAGNYHVIGFWSHKASQPFFIVSFGLLS